jgi:YggT family protein|tara:strand:+ start:247 stop:549 length:303 start_codon:yes stop_codon:yes gene_type:complete
VEVVRLVASVANILLLVFVFVLFARLILDYIPMFNRGWRPRGAGLVVAEIVYTVTDPPIRMFRRVIPPLRIGPVAIDFAFTITLLLCFVLMSVTSYLASS